MRDTGTTPSERARVRRLPDRGQYDKATVYGILDRHFLIHIAFVDRGQPFIIPTAYARDQDSILIHGSVASRMLKAITSAGAHVCGAVTSMQAMVLAKSAFHHSINYESVVIFGKAALVTDQEEKNGALFKIMEHLTPGRWDESRPPNEKELRATSVVKISIDEASAKIRTGPPKDDPEDEALDFWSGLIPIETTASPPPGASPSARNFKLPHARVKTV